MRGTEARVAAIDLIGTGLSDYEISRRTGASGPGRKDARQIILAGWQRAIVDEFPQEFLRGLIHSDGSRTINRFSVALASGQREYAYPRYFFTNLSADIRGLFCAACERMGVRWTQSSFKKHLRC